VPQVLSEADRGRQRIFIIEKVHRKKDPSRNKPPMEMKLACYYVAPDGWVYQCPPLDRLIDR
jgi:predicted protein tyrosine phosphatase